MTETNQTKTERLAQLQDELADLKGKLPEHCAGTKEYITVHRATAAHWQRIEEIEEEIGTLKKELGGLKRP